MGKDYQITGKNGSRELAKFLAANGQVMLPMVELIEECRIAVDDLVEVLGRSTLEAVLAISASGVAGEAHRGKRGGEIVRHGQQDGIVSLCNRFLVRGFGRRWVGLAARWGFQLTTRCETTAGSQSRSGTR